MKFNDAMTQEWIPVTERLPEDWQRVWFAWKPATKAKLNVTPGLYKSRQHKGKTVYSFCWSDGAYVCPLTFVTHWMPLEVPEPPGVE